MKKIIFEFVNKNRSILIISSFVISILICAIWYFVSYKYVTGWYQSSWAYYGLTFSNFNLLMLILLAIGGGGTAWIIYSHARRAKLPVSLLAAFCVAIIMAMSTILLYSMSVLVAIIVIVLLVKERRKKNVGIDNG